MRKNRQWTKGGLWLLFLTITASGALADHKLLQVDTPVVPPPWALMQRQLLRAQTRACRQFFNRYFDERGYLLCVERWGGNDGPDDAIESLNDWPILHALGADDEVLTLYKRAWEGHLRQYTEAKTSEVPFARDGMYYKEFPVMFDWLHNAEGLRVFNLQGLSDPNDPAFRQRVRRYAGFYLNEDPQAPNYDPKHRIIRSMFNGSRGPLLRQATALDWAGDPIEVEGRFKPRHGERNYQEMLEHFEDYNDIVGDHPQNLAATTLALNAYMLTGEPKYKRWLLEYVDAWRQRLLVNDGIIPTKIGLDGRIGGPQGKWYSGVYGWGFSVIVPQNGAIAHRNTHYLGLLGFSNALLLSGDLSYVLPWGQMIDKINGHKKRIDGRWHYPRMYGDQGWYAYSSRPYSLGARELYYWTLQPEDRERLPADGWLSFLAGEKPDFPEQALRGEFSRVRHQLAAMDRDKTTPDTRLSDDPMVYNPVAVGKLVQLMLGGLPPGTPLIGGPLHCRVRYFDPARRRAGIPEDVAALVEKMGPDETTLFLVNTNQLESRTLLVQAGAYGEHQIGEVVFDGHITPVAESFFAVQLNPGAGGRLQLKMGRYKNQPTLAFPWDRGWMLQEESDQK